MSSTADGEGTAVDDAAVEETPVDEVRQEMLGVLQDALGDALVGSHIEREDLWVRVDRSAWRTAAEVARDRLHCDYFCFLSGLDWLPNPDLLGEKAWDTEGSPVTGNDQPAEFQTGFAGGDTRFQVFARYYSTTRHWGLTVKADLDPADPRVESITSVYRGADWHERETWEMYGFDFEGHPRIRHLYLPGEFEGHPLRKDFPLLAREVKPWPGLVDVEPMPGEPEGDGDAEEAAS